MTIKADNVQIGQNATASQNFVLKQGADGTCTLARGNVGATTQDILTVDAAGKVTATQGFLSPITWYESAETAIPSIDVDTTVSHGLGSIPKQYQIVLRCKTAEYGYAIGDEVHFDLMDGDGARIQGAWANATSLGVRLGTSPPVVKHRASSGVIAITAANWKLVFRGHL